MKGSEFIFDSVDVLDYNLNKISLNYGGSYIDSPKWLKNKKATINLKNNDDKCFQYSLNHKHIKKLKTHYNACKNHDYCYVEDNKILKYNPGKKSMEAPFIIYADLESVVEKINTCHNNPEKSSSTKINEHTPSSYLLFTYCSFDTTKNKFDYYRGQNCMKNFCLDLRQHATKIINYEKKISLTNE